MCLPELSETVTLILQPLVAPEEGSVVQAKLDAITFEQIVLPLSFVMSPEAGTYWKKRGFGDAESELVYAMLQPLFVFTVIPLTCASSSPALVLIPCSMRSNARLAREEVLRNPVVSEYDHRNSTYKTIMPATTKLPIVAAISVSGREKPLDDLRGLSFTKAFMGARCWTVTWLMYWL